MFDIYETILRMPIYDIFLFQDLFYRIIPDGFKNVPLKKSLEDYKKKEVQLLLSWERDG